MSARRGLDAGDPAIDRRRLMEIRVFNNLAAQADRAFRVLRLARRRKQFTYNHDYVAPLAFADEVPDSHAPTWAWWNVVLSTADELLDNANALSRERRGVEHEPIQRRRLSVKKLREEVSAGAVRDNRKRDKSRRKDPDDDDNDLLDVLGDRIGALLDTPWQKVISDAADKLAVGILDGRAAALDGFEKLFVEVKSSGQNRGIIDDAEFVWLRLGGPNPMVLRRATVLPDRYPGQAADLRAAMARGRAAESLDRALAERRLYVCDYRGLEGLESGSFPESKVVPAPLAVFISPAGTRSLVPVAIQPVQKPGRAVWTPADGWSWCCAKLAVQVADGNLHESVAHLGRTHMLVEPFVVATERQLDETHPIYKLLRPHFEGTLFINNSAHSSLIAPGGTVDRLMSGTIQASRAAAVEGLLAIPFDQSDLDQDLARRGLVDAPIDHPYRDDARRVRAAIDQWVRDYVGLYYADDAAVVADEELQAWAAELVSKKGGRVRGFGEPDGSITTRAYLIRALGILIFTASAQHAAVNFPQYGVMSNASNFPLALYGQPPEQSATPETYLALLPPLEQALIQLNLGYLLGRVHYTRLGDYEDDWFEDKKVEPLLKRFQAELREVGEAIDRANETRERPYPYLHPAQVPQSINI